MAEEYNGWANHATWNVALWISNDEGLLNMAKECGSYSVFKDSLREIGGAIALETPDNVAWNDSAIDTDAINEMIDEE